MKNVKRILSTRLRELMEDRELTQNGLAKKAGVSQATVQRALNETQAITVEVMVEVCKAMHVHPAALLLSHDEIELLKHFKDLREHDKVNVLGYIGFQVAQNMKHEFTIPSSSTMAAAVRRANATDLKDDEEDPSSKLSRRRAS